MMGQSSFESGAMARGELRERLWRTVEVMIDTQVAGLRTVHGEFLADDDSSAIQKMRIQLMSSDFPSLRDVIEAMPNSDFRVIKTMTADERNRRQKENQNGNWQDKH